jgi:hypothetical protein
MLRMERKFVDRGERQDLAMVRDCQHLVIGQPRGLTLGPTGTQAAAVSGRSG